MLAWNVYIGNCNEQNIEQYNIFRHGSFLEDCKKAAKNNKKDKDAFASNIRNSLMYHYWSKYEWEIVLQHWPPHDRFKDLKIDVFDQVMLNWDAFVDYVWEHKKEL